MKILLSFLVLVILPVCLYSQLRYEVRGSVTDTTGNGISGATVKLSSATDTLFTKTGENGAYLISGITSLEFLLSVSNLGYQTLEKRFFLHNDRFMVVLGSLTLQPQAYELNQISILGKRAVIIKKDTIEYQTRNYRLRENAVMEELIRKLPGLSFNRDGSLYAQGRLVSRITLNGKDFFGGDLETALKNIPASLIERIQVIDDYGDMGRPGGAEVGNYTRIINIKTWADLRKGYFVNAAAGTGNEGRYQFSGMGNYFDNSREVAGYVNLNNNNSHLAGSDFANSAPGNGLNAMSGAGLNYREKLSKHFTSYGSYSFAKNVNNLLSETFRTNLYADNTLIRNNDTTTSKSTVYSHALQMNFEYSDSVNFLQVSPVFNFNSRQNSALADLHQARERFGYYLDGLHQRTRDVSVSELPTAGLKVTGSHKFNTDGRSVFAEIDVRRGRNTSKQNIDALMSFYDRGGSLARDSMQRQRIHLDNDNLATSARIVFVEPVSQLSRLEISYLFSYAHYNNDRQTRMDFSKHIDSLNNRYNYSFTTNTFRAAFKHSGKKHSYTFGLSVQPTLLSGRSFSDDASISKTALNIIPEVQYNYLISNEKSFAVNYTASSNPPSYVQLQPVTDLTNPQYPITGNPDLKSELAHNIELSYNSYSTTNGTSLFTSLTGSYIQNQVVVNTILNMADNNLVSQETRFGNVNGSYNMGAVYNLSIPVDNRTYVFEFNGAANYNHLVSLSNFDRLSNKNLILSQAIKMQISPNDKVDLAPSVLYTYNQNKYSLERIDFTKLSTWALGAGGRVGVLRSLAIGFQFDKNFNIGFTGSGRANPFIVNTYIEAQLFKSRRGALRLSAFDLLNQNTSVQRTVINNSVLDNRSNRLGRYFMLLFTINLSKFDVSA